MKPDDKYVKIQMTKTLTAVSILWLVIMYYPFGDEKDKKENITVHNNTTATI